MISRQLYINNVWIVTVIEISGGFEGFWEALKKEYESAEPPTGFQGIYD